MPKEKPRMEFRYYEIPAGDYVLPLLGRGWEQEYGVGYDGVLHFHNHLEIGYCYQGDGHLEVVDHTETYRGGNFTFIPKNIPHTTVSTPGHICKWEYLFVDADRFLMDIKKSNETDAARMLRLISERGYILHRDTSPQMEALVRQLLELCREQPVYYKESIKGYLYALLIEILRMNDTETRLQQEGQRFVRSGTYIQNALRFMESRYVDEISVADIAHACGLSESHFRRIFAQTMKVKPLDYLNQIRIRSACRMIEKEELSIHDVAYRAGYTTLSTFNRNFQRITGMTPGEWKKEKERHGEVRSKFRIHALKGWEGIHWEEEETPE